MAELNDRVSEEKFDQLIARLKIVYENGALRNRDWLAIYDIMLKACERDEAETLENYLAESLKCDVEGGDAE